MNRSATTIAERGYWQITNPAGIPQLIEQLRRATTIAEPCDCDSLGPITVEITTEPPDGPPCCVDAYWLRWISEHGIVLFSRSS